MSKVSGYPRSAPELFKLVMLVMLAQVAALFVRSWLQLAMVENGIPSWPARNVSYLIGLPLLVLLLYPVWKMPANSPRHNCQWRDLTFRIVLVGIALGTALRVAAWGLLLTQAGFGWRTDSTMVSPALVSFDCPAIPLIALHVLVMACVTPVVEETINRGWFAQWFLQFGNAFAIFASALLFAIVHQVDAMLPAFFFGLFSARLYIASGSLWGSMIAHAVYNCLIVIDWYCLRLAWNPGEFDAVTTALGAIGVALALCAYGLSGFLVSERVTGRLPGDCVTQNTLATRSMTCEAADTNPS